MKKKILSVLLLGAMLFVACASTTTKNETINKESTISYEENVFRYNETDYDLTNRNALINGIMGYQEIGEYILVEAYIGKDGGYYGVFHTKTQEFERDIIASGVAYQDGKIETLVYYFGNEIYNYQDELITRLDLSEQEYIYEISYAESGEQLKIEIANVATDEGKRIEVMEL